MTLRWVAPQRGPTDEVFGRYPERATQAIRNHWDIESMRWVLDVIFKEDRSVCVAATAHRIWRSSAASPSTWCTPERASNPSRPHEKPQDGAPTCFNRSSPKTPLNLDSVPWAACKVGVTTEGCTILAKGLAGSLGRGPEDRMAELITVDRSDGRAVAGLVTSLLVNWDHIPPGVQAAIIRHADAAAFESAGRSDGSYVVTAFVLRHRAALARSARVRTGAGSRGWRAVEMVAAQRRRLGEAATRLRVLRWLASLRKAA